MVRYTQCFQRILLYWYAPSEKISVENLSAPFLQFHSTLANKSMWCTCTITWQSIESGGSRKTIGSFTEFKNGIGDNRQIRAEGMQKWWWTFRYLDLHAHLQINEKNLCLPENQAQKNKSAHWWTARGYDAVHKKNRGSCGRETERGWKQFAKGQNKIAITNTEIVMQIKFLIIFPPRSVKNGPVAVPFTRTLGSVPSKWLLKQSNPGKRDRAFLVLFLGKTGKQMFAVSGWEKWKRGSKQKLTAIQQN